MKPPNDRGGEIPIGVVSVASYLPYWCLSASTIADALGTKSTTTSRLVASHDEDTTSMAVEAARRLSPSTNPPETLWLATTMPAYADRTNAVGMHAALRLPDHVFSADVVGAIRSGLGAMRAALSTTGLAVLSDVRTGLPGSADEARGGDAAVAIQFGRGRDVIAEWLYHESLTVDFLDRWRVPGARNSKTWEERFTVQEYLPITKEVVSRVLQRASLDKPDHVAVLSPDPRTTREMRNWFDHECLSEDLTDKIGFTGTAHLGLALGQILQIAKPGQTILLVQASDGADAILLRTTDQIGNPEATKGPWAGRNQINELDYISFLTWRGLLQREPPRRPEPVGPAAPPAVRNREWKMGLVGSQCQACGRTHAPPQRVCTECHIVDNMLPHPLADKIATVATYTVDHLAHSLSPPVIAAMIDFEGGGRIETEITDADPEAISVGDNVEMTFRRRFTADGVHNYFWKARPVRES